jgi:hypothetical protein
MLERSASVEVRLFSDDFQLDPASPEALANGANRALIGGEVLQFTTAERLAAACWRLCGLLRGRGGTEAAASAGHKPDEPFVLLDDALMTLDPTQLGPAGKLTVAALGLADQEPVTAQLANSGLGRKPLSPVHPRVVATAEGGLTMRWTRRARGAWLWEDHLDAPLVEPTERYLVGLGDSKQPTLRWEVSQARLELGPDQLARLAPSHPGQPVWVRQVGLYSLSEPLLLTIL